MPETMTATSIPSLRMFSVYPCKVARDCAAILTVYGLLYHKEKILVSETKQDRTIRGVNGSIVASASVRCDPDSIPPRRDQRVAPLSFPRFPVPARH